MHDYKQAEKLNSEFNFFSKDFFHHLKSLVARYIMLQFILILIVRTNCLQRNIVGTKKSMKVFIKTNVFS
jgi:hypothetical protein